MNMNYAKQPNPTTDFNDLFKAEVQPNQPAPFGGPISHQPDPKQPANISTGNQQTDDFLAELEKLKKL